MSATIEINNNNIVDLKNKMMGGDVLSRGEVETLITAPLDELCVAANDIRKHFCGSNFDLCSVFNGKCGKCSEDCAFCAQSSFYKTQITDKQLEFNYLFKSHNYNPANFTKNRMGKTNDTRL